MYVYVHGYHIWKYKKWIAIKKNSLWKICQKKHFDYVVLVGLDFIVGSLVEKNILRILCALMTEDIWVLRSTWWENALIYAFWKIWCLCVEKKIFALYWEMLVWLIIAQKHSKNAGKYAHKKKRKYNNMWIRDFESCILWRGYFLEVSLRNMAWCCGLHCITMTSFGMGARSKG